MKKFFTGMMLIGTFMLVGYIPGRAADSENLHKIYTDDGELVTIEPKDRMPETVKPFGKGGKIKFLKGEIVEITTQGQVRKGMVFVCELVSHAPSYIHYDNGDAPGRRWCPKPKEDVLPSNKKK